ncbi:MAG: TlyA family RNA methyltransferase [Deltaproteobacteria bacterium]|nr:TlyA family RNA methyltransferase [Deltaproteobacteria bacterium]
MCQKNRIDKILFERGLAPSRERAQAYIMSGNVLVNEVPVTKSGSKIDINATIRIKGMDQPFVGRGGLKLEKAIEQFSLSIKHKIAMDVGASTGGFTDCLLQHGAVYVFAVDVGHNQLAWDIRQHPKVKDLEKTNFRNMPFSIIGTFVDIIVIDVSFISLTKIFNNCLNFLTQKGDLIALIKPQFEAGKENINKGGFVSKENIKADVIASITKYAESVGFFCRNSVISSPIQGKKSGNQEFLIHLGKQDNS